MIRLESRQNMLLSDDGGGHVHGGGGRCSCWLIILPFLKPRGLSVPAVDDGSDL